MLYNICSMAVGVLGLVASVLGLIVTWFTFRKAESIREALNKQIQKQKIYPQLEKTIKSMKDNTEYLKSQDSVNTWSAINEVFENLNTLNTYNRDPDIGNLYSKDLEYKIDNACRHMKECSAVSGGLGYWVKHMDEYTNLEAMLDMEETKRYVR